MAYYMTIVVHYRFCCKTNFYYFLFSNNTDYVISVYIIVLAMSVDIQVLNSNQPFTLSNKHFNQRHVQSFTLKFLVKNLKMHTILNIKQDM